MLLWHDSYFFLVQQDFFIEYLTMYRLSVDRG